MRPVVCGDRRGVVGEVFNLVLVLAAEAMIWAALVDASSLSLGGMISDRTEPGDGIPSLALGLRPVCSLNDAAVARGVRLPPRGSDAVICLSLLAEPLADRQLVVLEPRAHISTQSRRQSTRTALRVQSISSSAAGSIQTSSHGSLPDFGVFGLNGASAQLWWDSRVVKFGLARKLSCLFRTRFSTKFKPRLVSSLTVNKISNPNSEPCRTEPFGCSTGLHTKQTRTPVWLPSSTHEKLVYILRS